MSTVPFLPKVQLAKFSPRSCGGEKYHNSLGFTPVLSCCLPTLERTFDWHSPFTGGQTFISHRSDPDPPIGDVTSLETVTTELSDRVHLQDRDGGFSEKHAMEKKKMNLSFDLFKVHPKNFLFLVK